MRKMADDIGRRACTTGERRCRPRRDTADHNARDQICGEPFPAGDAMPAHGDVIPVVYAPDAIVSVSPAFVFFGAVSCANHQRNGVVAESYSSTPTT